MTEGKRFDEWDRASAIQAAVYNSERTKKDGLVCPSLFNPFTAKKAKQNRPRIKDPTFLAAMCGVHLK